MRIKWLKMDEIFLSIATQSYSHKYFDALKCERGRKKNVNKEWEKHTNDEVDIIIIISTTTIGSITSLSETAFDIL